MFARCACILPIVQYVARARRADVDSARRSTFIDINYLWSSDRSSTCISITPFSGFGSRARASIFIIYVFNVALEIQSDRRYTYTIIHLSSIYHP